MSSMKLAFTSAGFHFPVEEHVPTHTLIFLIIIGIIFIIYVCQYVTDWSQVVWGQECQNWKQFNILRNKFKYKGHFCLCLSHLSLLMINGKKNNDESYFFVSGDKSEGNRKTKGKQIYVIPFYICLLQWQKVKENDMMYLHICIYSFIYSYLYFIFI